MSGRMTEYQVTYISVPHEPCPLDFCEIPLKNSTPEPRQGRLAIHGRGKPQDRAGFTLGPWQAIVGDDPAVPVEHLQRDVGFLADTESVQPRLMDSLRKALSDK
jgi:hypothetical protein